MRIFVVVPLAVTLLAATAEAQTPSGFGRRVASWLELGIDAGVLYQGKPRVSLAASGAFANNPALQADLDQERASIRSKIDWTEWYPALTIWALFRF